MSVVRRLSPIHLALLLANQGSGTLEPILQFFKYEHLPPALQAVSKPFCDLATQLVASLPRNPERTVALRKLLESKDSAVRAALYKDVV